MGGLWTGGLKAVTIMIPNKKAYCSKVIVTLLLFTFVSTICTAKGGVDTTATRINDSSNVCLTYSAISAPGVNFPSTTLAVKQYIQTNTKKTRSRFWDYFGLGLEAAYHTELCNLYTKKFEGQISPFESFYWNNSLWLKMDWSTPIGNIAFQFDFPIYSTTRENLHQMRASYNFYGLSANSKMRNGAAMLVELLLPSVNYNYIGSRTYVNQNVDVSALWFLRYIWDTKTYFTKEGSRKETTHYFYYLSISRYFEGMANYSFYFHRLCSAHGITNRFIPLMQFKHFPLPFADLGGYVQIINKYDANNALLDTSKESAMFGYKLGLMWVDDFFIRSANVLIQPRLFWTIWGYDPGLNVSLGFQFFM